MPHDLSWDASGVPNQAPPHTVLIALLVILTLLITAVGGYAYSRLADEQRRETEGTLTLIAEQKRQQLENWLAQTRDDARLFFTGKSFLLQRLAAWEGGGRQDVTLLDLARERISEFMEVRGWSSLAVLDTRGEPMILLGPTSIAAHAGAVQEVLAHPRLLPVDLHLNPQGQVEYGLLAPMTLPGGRLLGVAYLSWLADQSLFPLIASWPVPTETAETFLVRREGEEVLYLTPLRHEATAALTKRLPLATPALPSALAARGQEGILPEARDYRNEPVLAYATAIAGSPWVMVAKIDQREAQAEIRETAWVTALILALVLLLTYITAFAWWRRDQDRVLAVAREAKARLESEQHWKRALDAAGHGVWDSNLDTQRVSYSPTWKHMLGYDEAAIGDTFDAWEQLVHPEDLARVWATVKAYLAGETPRYESMHRLRCQDGTWKWFLDRGTAFERDATGRPRRMLGTNTDITPQKQAEAALAATNIRLQGLLDTLPVGVAFTDGLDPGHIQTNLTLQRMFELPPAAEISASAPDASAAGRQVRYFHAGRELGADELPLQRVLAERQFIPPLELEIALPSGRHWIAEITGVPLRDDRGQLIGGLAVLVDITARKRAEDDLRASQERAEEATRAKSEFLAQMSHEIRTPLYSMLGLAQLIGRAPLNPQQRDMVGRIQTAGESLLGILNDILDMAKIEANHLQIQARPFDLPTLLQRLANLYGPTASQKGLSFSLQVPPLAPHQVTGDDLRLEQVLGNLISNAIKFTEQGEVVLQVQLLEASEEQWRLRFSVRDTGIGIGPATLRNLFQPFIQAERGHGRRYGGTGLGLTISKRLVEMMNGAMGVDSQPGKGSHFWVELPFRLTRVRRELPTAAALPWVRGRSGLKDLRVLVVDDSPEHRDLMDQALRMEGAEVTLAREGTQAIDCLKAHPGGYDLVLMDLQMPGMDGFTATRMIREELGLRELPIIALTAGVLPEQRQAALDAGVDEILTKPIDLDQITACLSIWVSPPAEATPTDITAPQGAESLHPSSDRALWDPGPAASFPDIAGINRRRVEQHLAGNRAIFLKLLRGFAAQFSQVMAEIRADLDLDKRKEAAGRVHRLRGYAATIGAMGLGQQAGVVEEAIRRDETELVEPLQVLETELAALLAAIAPWTTASGNNDQRDAD